MPLSRHDNCSTVSGVLYAAVGYESSEWREWSSKRKRLGWLIMTLFDTIDPTPPILTARGRAVTIVAWALTGWLLSS
jgi:hypothetical protein